jgi:hypothetical protein
LPLGTGAANNPSTDKQSSAMARTIRTWINDSFSSRDLFRAGAGKKRIGLFQ